MAEQEACAELVEKASQEQSSGKIEGESLLLPLLQGLLQTPEKDQTVDSGTESGEDQRNGLIAEVQNALDKLSQSLCSDSTDISQERRSSLLHLVTKLQAGLSSAVPKLQRRLSGEPGRFNRRKNRQNRHTIGVSSEELADARRLMEEISGHKVTAAEKDTLNIQKQNSETSVTSNPPNITFLPKKESESDPAKLSKQNSDSSVTSNPSVNKYFNKSSVKNTTPKPFNSNTNSISNNSSTVQTPDISEHLDGFFGEESPYENHKPLRQDSYLDNSILKTQQKIIESENEDDTIKMNESRDEQNILQYNPIYSKPDNTVYNQPTENTREQRLRFNTDIKKQKMKRANTIDIPKPLQFYEETDDSDGETEAQQHKNNYYALRGPIRVGNPINKRTVPVFEPKTASDQKFLAFLNKNQNPDEPQNKSSAWTNQKNRTPVWENKFGNIKNNFENAGRVPSNNVKNFWKTQDDAIVARTNQFGPKISRQSARNLQQMFEDKQRESQERMIPPHQIQRVSKEILPVKNEQNAITGKLTVKTEPEKNYRLVPGPLPVNKFSHAPQSAFKPIAKKPQTYHQIQPTIREPINNESKDLLKTEIKENNKNSLFLYSPKPLPDSQENSPSLSPIGTKPWLSTGTESGSRVLSIAAKKFEVGPQHNETPIIKPRKLSKELSSNFVPQQMPKEKTATSYLSRNDSRSSTVRKLSDQYDTLGNKTPEYTSHTSVTYQPASPLKNRDPFSPKTPTQDYSRPKFPQSNPKDMKTSLWHQAYQDRVNPAPNYPQPQPRLDSLANERRHNYQPTYSKQDTVEHEKRFKPFQPIVNQNQSLKPQPVYQHVPGTDSPGSPQTPENVYTSTLTFNPTAKLNAPKTEIVTQPPKLETQLSCESIHEYTAINSKVMGGPVSQQAVTVRQKSPMTRNEHDIAAAFSLKNTLSNIGKSEDKTPKTSPVSPASISPQRSFHKSPVSSKIEEDVKRQNEYNSNQNSIPNKLSSNSFTSKVSEPRTILNTPPTSIDNKAFGVVKPMQQKQPQPTMGQPMQQKQPQPTIGQPMQQKQPQPTIGQPMQQKQPQPSMGPIYNNVARFQSATAQNQQFVEFNEKGQGVVTSKFHIPIVNVEPNTPGVTSPGSVSPLHGRALSKSDSWHQICMAASQSPTKPAPARNVVKSKSSHSLAVPQRQFEAGMSKDELLNKRRAMEAYLMGGTKSPQQITTATKTSEKVVKSSINRIKTSEKQSAFKSSGLSRSRTLPDIVCPPLLDESNVDQAFEDLFQSSS